MWEEFVIDILKRIKKGGWLEPLIRTSIDSGRIPKEASKFVSEVSYGVVRYFYLLDWIARQLLGDKRWAKLPELAKWIILVGLYQLKFHSEDKAPSVCFRLVELTKRLFHIGLAGLVNAVFRSYLRDKPEPSRDDLALYYSYPDWLVEKLLSSFEDRNFVEFLLKKGNERPKLFIRVNLNKVDVKDFSFLLYSRGIDFEEIGLLGDCFLIKEAVFPREIPGWDEGLFWMEGLSSSLAVKALDIAEGDEVLDLCAGRGVKSADIAQRLRGRGRLISIDIYPWKLKVLRDFLNRLGYRIDGLIAWDLKISNPRLEGWASKAILDVPCSNLSDLGGKPEVKLRLSPLDVERLVSLQTKMLEVASKYIKRGGVLVYSTCTFHPEENEGVVESFLRNHPEYEMLSPDWVSSFAVRVADYGFYIEDGFFSPLKRR